MLTRARSYHTDRSKANHALTFNLDHSSRANHFLTTAVAEEALGDVFTTLEQFKKETE